MATQPDDLHAANFYAWTRDQAAALRRDAEEQLPTLYAQALRKARKALADRGEAEAARALPAENPYRLEDLLRHDWYPASRHGLVDEF